jgi:hypothetical protein
VPTWALLFTLAFSIPLSGQSADLLRERSDFAAWLASAPDSPLAGIVQQPIGRELRIGPSDSDIPLAGVEEFRLAETNGRVTLHGSEGSRQIPRGRPFRLGDHTFSVGGIPGRMVVTVFGPARKPHVVTHYPHDRSLVFTGALTPPNQPGTVRLLGLDGIEVEAAEAGTVVVPMGGRPTSLRVRRLPVGEDEYEMEIFFRDSTNAAGTYPAGRFVSLLPTGDGRYRLDFNRARNPFCAYSSAFPCPAPWQGNALPASVRGGERYGE